MIYWEALQLFVYLLAPVTILYGVARLGIACKEKLRKEYRRGFLAGFNFAVGKGGLPPEIINWPSAMKEVTQDAPTDPRCS